MSFKIKLMHLGMLSTGGAIMFIVDIIRYNQVTFGSRIEDFNVSLLGVLGNAIASLGLIVWLYSLYNYRVNRRKIPIVAYFSVLSYVAGGILSAGRQAIILIILTSLVLLVWSSLNNKKAKSSLALSSKGQATKPWGFYVLMALFISYFVFVSLVRSGISNVDNKIVVFEKMFNSTTSLEAKDIVHSIGGLSDIYIEFAYYYSHELVRLDLLFEYYDYEPLFGLSQMSYFERRLRWLFGNQGENSWRQVEIALEDKGKISSHTWGTFVADYIVDFGRLGAPIVCLVTGIFAGIIYRKFKSSQNAQTVIRQCIICGGGIFSIQFSPISELTYFIPLLLCSFFLIKENNVDP